MKNNSADLGKHPNILKWKNKGVRMFSVDGGHNYDEVLNDLAVAYLTSLNEGVIIVDDFQHMGWDGVFNGTMEFLKGEFDGPYTKFVPLAIGGNKLFLVREDAKDLYKDLKGLTEEEYFKTVNNTLTDKKVRAIIENYPGVVLFPEQQYQFTQNEFRI